jgi:hypothetical protein
MRSVRPMSCKKLIGSLRKGRCHADVTQAGIRVVPRIIVIVDDLAVAGSVRFVNGGGVAQMRAREFLPEHSRLHQLRESVS